MINTKFGLKQSLVAMLLAGLVMIPSMASADGGFTGTDAATTANCQRYRDNTTAQKQAELQKYVPQPANEFFTSSTCLDSILNTRINIFTMGSLDSILSQLMNMVTSRACAAVMGAWNNTVGQANQTLGTNVNVPYVGNIGGVGVGSTGSGGFGGSPITVNNQSANTAVLVNTVSSTASSTASSVSSAATSATNSGSSVLNSVFK